MKNIVMALLTLAASSSFAADVTLIPNGHEVNINGTSVVCNDQGTTGVNGASDQIVIGMAMSDRLGSCSATKDSAGNFHVLLYSAGGIYQEVGRYPISATAAQALRGYYNAGACKPL